MKFDDVVTKIKKIRPVYIIGGAGAIVVLFSFFRRKSNSYETMSPAEVYSQGTGGAVSSGDSSALAMVTELTSILEKERDTINDLTKQVGDLGKELDSTKTGFNSAFNNVVSAYERTETVTQSILKQVSDTAKTQQNKQSSDPPSWSPKIDYASEINRIKAIDPKADVSGLVKSGLEKSNDPAYSQYKENWVKLADSLGYDDKGNKK